MAFIKKFRTVQVRVPDPLHPGKRVFEDRMFDAGCTGLTFEGAVYEADEDGWFDVPPEVAEHYLRHRHPGGEKFYSPEEVDEQVRLGSMAEERALPAEKPARRGRAAKPSAE
jgi:hypothetical protein